MFLLPRFFARLFCGKNHAANSKQTIFSVHGVVLIIPRDFNFHSYLQNIRVSQKDPASKVSSKNQSVKKGLKSTAVPFTKSTEPNQKEIGGKVLPKIVSFSPVKERIVFFPRFFLLLITRPIWHKLFSRSSYREFFLFSVPSPRFLALCFPFLLLSLPTATAFFFSKPRIYFVKLTS